MLLPLYDCRGGNGTGADYGCACQKPGSCQGGYQIGAFACLDIQHWVKGYNVPKKPGTHEECGHQRHRGDHQLQLHRQLRPEGRTPGPGDALVPSLVH